MKAALINWLRQIFPHRAATTRRAEAARAAEAYQAKRAAERARYLRAAKLLSPTIDRAPGRRSTPINNEGTMA